MRKRRSRKPFTLKHRPPYSNTTLDYFIDPKRGDDKTGDGSPEKPFRTFKALERYWDQLEKDHFETQQKANREKSEREAREWTEKQNEQRAKEDAERDARKAEQAAKAKELDNKIAQLEVELTSLEKTYLETTHLFELAQLELMAAGPSAAAAFPGVPGLSELATFNDDRKEKLNEAKILATQLHHLRMALMARNAEHDALVQQRGKKTSWESILGGPMMWALLGGAAMWAYRLFAKSMEKGP